MSKVMNDTDTAHYKLLNTESYQYRLPVVTASFNCVKNLCETHELVINSSKTQLIVFKPVGRRIPDEFHLSLDNCTVTPQKTVKSLWVTFDQHFTFGPHIDNVGTKRHGLLGTLARATPYLPRQLLKLSYTQLSSDLIWNIVARYLHLQPRLVSRNLILFNV